MTNVLEWMDRTAREVVDEFLDGEERHVEGVAQIIAKHAPRVAEELGVADLPKDLQEASARNARDEIRDIRNGEHPVQLVAKARDVEVRELAVAATEALSAEHSHNRDKFARLRRALEPFKAVK